MHVSTMNQLGEQVQQQVMTNNLLMRQQDLLERQNVSNEEALTAAIEQVSQEIKTTADGYKAAVSAPYDGLKAALGHTSVKLTGGQ